MLLALKVMLLDAEVMLLAAEVMLLQRMLSLSCVLFFHQSRYDGFHGGDIIDYCFPQLFWS